MSAAKEEELNPYRVRLVYGWGGLARHLSSLGVHVTGDALESRRRRHGYECYGGGRARGRGVFFDREHISRWFAILTGGSLVRAERVAFRAHRDGDPAPSYKRVRHARGDDLEALRPPHWTLYVLLESAAMSRVERVLREPTGTSYATHDPRCAETWSQCGEVRRPWTCWRFSRMRRATPADLHAPVHRHAEFKVRSSARMLLAAVLSDGYRLKWVQVPGHFYGLKKGVTTYCLGPKQHAHYAAVKQWVNAHCPRAIWLAWSDRQQIDPVTLDRIDPFFDPEHLTARDLGM